MTGLTKFILIGGAAAGGAAALYLSKVKKNLNTVFKIPSVFGLVNNYYLRLQIPADIYNYTGFKFTLKRFRIRVMYITNDARGKEVENLLGISPTVLPQVQFGEDIRSANTFLMDVDPAVIFSLKSTTPLRIYADFTLGFFPVTITVEKTLDEILPITFIKDKAQGLLDKLGITIRLNGLPTGRPQTQLLIDTL